MSKINKTKLARGTRLNIEQVWDNNLDEVAANINNANTNEPPAVPTPSLSQPQYSSGNGTFRLTWNIPWFGSRWTQNNGGGDKDTTSPYVIPFVVFPLQEFLSPIGQTNENTPQVVMTEFSYGFDQRGEPALPTDPLCGPGTSPAPVAPAAAATNQPWDEFMRSQDAVGFISAHEDWNHYFMNQNCGKSHYDIAGRGDLGFAILKKEMNYFLEPPGSPAAFDRNVCQESIYALTVPMSTFIGQHKRLNPHVEKELNVLLSPYNTYCLAIYPPRLDDPDQTSNTTQDNCALVNLTISAKFTHPLVNRDVDLLNGATNIPLHGGAKTKDTLTLTKPLVGSAVEADTADGVNTTMTAIDSKFREKLNSGYDAASNNPPIEQLCQDAAYEIIAIPMWNNQRSNQFTFRDAFACQAPYSIGTRTASIKDAGGNDVVGRMTRRAIVPINYPFTIHHVILAANVYNADFVPIVNARATKTYHDAWGATGWEGPQYPYPGSSAASGAPLLSDSRPIHHIGIAIGNGKQGTQYGYKQVVNYSGLNFNDPASTLLTLDKIKTYDNTTYRAIRNAFAAGKDFDGGGAYTQSLFNWNNWHLMYLPLNGQGSTLAPGLFDAAGNRATIGAPNTQDPPYFCGESWVQRDLANVPGAVPTIDSYDGTSPRITNIVGPAKRMGGDQWIEVRWNVEPQDAAGNILNWETLNGIMGATPGDESKIIHGYGGHWIYIIGKKHVVSNSSWEDTNLKGGM